VAEAVPVATLAQEVMVILPDQARVVRVQVAAAVVVALVVATLQAVVAVASVFLVKAVAEALAPPTVPLAVMVAQVPVAQMAQMLYFPAQPAQQVVRMAAVAVAGVLPVAGALKALAEPGVVALSESSGPVTLAASHQLVQVISNA
jgi:hypothetical protein